MGCRITMVAVAVTCLFAASTAFAGGKAEGEGIYLMGPEMPSVFSFDRDSMSCSVSWGTMGAPGPGLSVARFGAAAAVHSQPSPSAMPRR